MAAPHNMFAARRVVLHIDELELLRVLAGGPELPADFRVEEGADPSAAVDPLAALRARGLVVTDAAEPGRLVVHRAIARDLAVLSAPDLLIETRVGVGDGPRRQALKAAHAVAGAIGASLVRAESGTGVELSVFAAASLGVELRRAVPDAATAQAGAAPPTGLLALAALVELPIAADLGGSAVVAALAEELQIPPEERELALELRAARPARCKRC